MAAGVASAILGADFTDAGHTIAVILGVLVSARFRQPIRWTPVLYLMLAASSGEISGARMPRSRSTRVCSRDIARRRASCSVSAASAHTQMVACGSGKRSLGR